MSVFFFPYLVDFMYNILAMESVSAEHEGRLDGIKQLQRSDRFIWFYLFDVAQALAWRSPVKSNVACYAAC